MAAAKNPVKEAGRLVRKIDRIQQDRSWLAIGVATWKKFSDDQAGNLAALVAYYAFASLFPLLLVAYTVLELVAKASPSVAKRLTSALSKYPVVGQLGLTHGVAGTGVALVIGVLVTLYASLGVANAIQNAMNTAWSVPKYQRPGFPRNQLRSLGLIAVIGPGEVLTIALSTVAGGAGRLGGAGGQVAAFIVALLLNVGLFRLSFRLATSKDVSSRDMRLGAILAAIAWQLLTFALAKGILHLHNSAYGTFGSVLAILAWFYLQAQITLYLVELDVVRARRLWPRSLVPPPLTSADMRAYQAYAETSQLRPDLKVSVDHVPQQRTEPDRQGGSAQSPAHPATAVDASRAGEAAVTRPDDRPSG